MKLIESSPTKVKTTVQQDESVNGTPSSRSSGKKKGLRKLMHKMGSRKSKKLLKSDDHQESSKKIKFFSVHPSSRSDWFDTNSQSSTSSLSDDATSATPSSKVTKVEVVPDSPPAINRQPRDSKVIDVDEVPRTRLSEELRASITSFKPTKALHHISAEDDGDDKNKRFAFSSISKSLRKSHYVAGLCAVAAIAFIATRGHRLSRSLMRHFL